MTINSTEVAGHHIFEASGVLSDPAAMRDIYHLLNVTPSLFAEHFLPNDDEVPDAVKIKTDVTDTGATVFTFASGKQNAVTVICVSGITDATRKHVLDTTIEKIRSGDAGFKLPEGFVSVILDNLAPNRHRDLYDIIMMNSTGGHTVRIVEREEFVAHAKRMKVDAQLTENVRLITDLSTVVTLTDGGAPVRAIAPETFEAMKREQLAADLAGIDGTIVHVVTRKRDLDMNGRIPAKDEAYFRTAVDAWDSMRRSHAYDALIYVTVDGYENDPRELWQIPEVVTFMGRWVEATDALREKRLSPLTRDLLKAFAAGGAA